MHVDTKPVPLKQEMTCNWIDPDQPSPKKVCNKTFHSLHEIVNHLTRGTTWAVRSAPTRLLLAELLQERAQLQGQVQAGQPHPGTTRGRSRSRARSPAVARCLRRSENLKIHKRTHTGKNRRLA
ncbi:Pair-rule protein odd-paired [Amphibalanus amphitrite]|uniref:Pair-rule protein odd-paired n=1 Tax=Amphibalanus amphitrite TaxID=1232801 RepID=A0A6A4V6W3_AMPAM|nr:Pair-rule protein odd-paired [Amphibalanus amphitrite]